jgi:hypothetical protein
MNWVLRGQETIRYGQYLNLTEALWFDTEYDFIIISAEIDSRVVKNF